MNCECDNQLASTLSGLKSAWKSTYYTFRNGHGFDYATKCHAVINQGGNGGNGGSAAEDQPIVNNGTAVEEFQCCGTYPHRFKFSTREGSKACCGEKTYDTNKLDCCEGDFLGQIGSCDAQRK